MRRIKQAPEHLCLGHHPVVLHLRQCKARRSQWMKRVAELVYRCNVDEMFTETRGQQRGHKRAIERVRRQVKAVVEPRAPVSATSVLAHALTDHLREMLSEDSILSVPVCALQGLSEAISRGPVSSVGRSLWSPDEGDDCSAAADATCRIVHLRPAQWKMMPLNSLAGVRVSAGALAVAPLHHFRLEGATGRAAADAVSFTADGISMFEAIADDATLQALRMHGKKWEVDSGSGDNGAGADTSSILVLVIKGLAEQSWEIAEVLRQLFEQRAFPCTTTRWTVLRSDRRSSPLFDLQRHGLVDSIDSLTKPGLAASWQFTQKGLKSVLTCAKLGEASALCDVRLGVPLRDRSSYELQLMLQDGGWAWHPLPGPRTRARQQLRAYSVGGPLLWYAGSSQSFMVIREYLLCLLDAEVLRGSGISEIPHGLAQHTYALLLRGIPLAQHPPPPAPARRRVLHLEPDGEEAGPPEEAAEAEEAEHPEHDGDDGDTDDDDDDEADAWSLTDALAAVIDEAEEDRSMQLAQPPQQLRKASPCRLCKLQGVGDASPSASTLRGSTPSARTKDHAPGTPRTSAPDARKSSASVAPVAQTERRHSCGASSGVPRHSRWRGSGSMSSRSRWWGTWTPRWSRRCASMTSLSLAKWCRTTSQTLQVVQSLGHSASG